MKSRNYLKRSKNSMANIRPSSVPQGPAQRLSEFMTSWLSETDPTDIWQSCVSCRFFEDDRLCSKYGKNPPGSVIVKGCPAYEDAVEIPF